jgi:hypothetical protein
MIATTDPRSPVDLREMLNKVPEITLQIILSTLPHSVSGRFHVDLPHRVAHLRLPLTTVTAQERPVPRPIEDLSAEAVG